MSALYISPISSKLQPLRIQLRRWDVQQPAQVATLLNKELFSKPQASPTYVLAIASETIMTKLFAIALYDRNFSIIHWVQNS